MTRTTRDDTRLRMRIETLQRRGAPEHEIEEAVRDAIRDDRRLASRKPTRRARRLLRRAQSTARRRLRRDRSCRNAEGGDKSPG